MDKILKWLPTVLVLAAIIFVYLAGRRDQRKTEELLQYWQKKGFKTDTVYVDVDYSKIPKPIFKYEVPPQKVYTYPQEQVNHIKVILSDSLIQIIDSLENRITQLSVDYLKLYPSASKLIYAQFSLDSLNLDLLSIDGRLRSHVYPWDLTQFRYQWVDGEMRAEKVSRKITRAELYGSGGYDLAFKAPILGIDYSVYRGSFRFRASSHLSIERNPEFSASGTIGLKIK